MEAAEVGAHGQVDREIAGQQLPTGLSLQRLAPLLLTVAVSGREGALDLDGVPDHCSADCQQSSASFNP